MIIEKASAYDVLELAPRLRRQDAEEVLASGSKSSYEALDYSFRHSTVCYAVKLDGVCVALFGLVPDALIGPSAKVWFLGSPELGRMKKSFVKLSRVYINEFLNRYSILWNVVDARYEKTRRWLTFCGAAFSKTPMTLNGYDFYKFAIWRA